MREKYDYRAMIREVREDEKVYRMKPVLLTQREIQEMMAKRKNGTRARKAST